MKHVVCLTQVKVEQYVNVIQPSVALVVQPSTATVVQPTLVQSSVEFSKVDFKSVPLSTQPPPTITKIKSRAPTPKPQPVNKPKQRIFDATPQDSSLHDAYDIPKAITNAFMKLCENNDPKYNGEPTSKFHFSNKETKGISLPEYIER